MKKGEKGEDGNEMTGRKRVKKVMEKGREKKQDTDVHGKTR